VEPWTTALQAASGWSRTLEYAETSSSVVLVSDSVLLIMGRG